MGWVGGGRGGGAGAGGGLLNLRLKARLTFLSTFGPRLHLVSRK